MAGFYSLVVLTNDELVLPEQRLVLFPGVNTFNTALDDADAFCGWLAQQGCKVQQINRLDEEEISEPLPALV